MINSRSLDDLTPPVKKRAQAFVDAAKAKGIPLQVPQVGSMFSLFFNAEKVRNYDQAIASNGDLYRKVFRYALDHGVYLAPSPYETAFLSTAHEGKDIDQACTVLDAAIRAL